MNVRQALVAVGICVSLVAIVYFLYLSAYALTEMICGPRERRQ